MSPPSNGSPRAYDVLKALKEKAKDEVSSSRIA
jgi:hypothetical protein